MMIIERRKKKCKLHQLTSIKRMNETIKYLPTTENLFWNGTIETFDADGCQVAGSSFEFCLENKTENF